MSTIFETKAPGIMLRLMSEFSLTLQSAAAILGNLGHESAGFTSMQEINPVNGGAGGLGWAQWTGPRRREFVEFCRRNGYDTRSDIGNLSFLMHELRGSQAAALRGLNEAGSLRDAVMSFEAKFERADPRYKHYDRRVAYAEKAIRAYERTVQPPQTELKPSLS